MILQARFHHATLHALIIYTVCFTFELGILETKRISKLLISFPNAVLFSFGFEQKLTQVFMRVRGFVKGYFKAT